MAATKAKAGTRAAGRGARGAGPKKKPAAGRGKGGAAAGSAGSAASAAKRPGMSAVTAMIGMVPQAAANRFLAAELVKSPDALDRFAAVARKERAKKLQKDYKAEANALLARARGTKGFIDKGNKTITFASQLKDAKDSEKVLDFAEAARIYGGVCEAILDNLEYMYSGSGPYSRLVYSCIEKMAACAANARGEAERRGILSGMMGMWIARARYSHIFEDAMLAGLDGTGDVDHLLGMLGAAEKKKGGLSVYVSDDDMYSHRQPEDRAARFRAKMKEARGHIAGGRRRVTAAVGAAGRDRGGRRKALGHNAGLRVWVPDPKSPYWG